MTRYKDFAHGRSTLLCLSTHDGLREVRGRVLATRYPVIVIQSQEEMGALPQSSAVSLLILCHSLSNSQCHVALLASRDKWPPIKVLSITTPFSGCRGDGIDAEVSGLAGPMALFSSIEALLGTPQSSAIELPK